MGKYKIINWKGLTLIWVGFLGVRFEVEGGKITSTA